MFAENEFINPVLSRLQNWGLNVSDLYVEANPPALYILVRGIASRTCRTMSLGDVWGEDFVLRNPLLRKRSAARCVTYVEVLCLPRPTLLDVLDTHPHDAITVRRSTVRLAVRRGIVRLANEVRRLRAMQPSGAPHPFDDEASKDIVINRAFMQ